MAQVFVSVGSNIEPAANIRRGVAALAERYGRLLLSSVYQSRAVGFAGEDFYNLALGFATDEDVRRVAGFLREVEERYGRIRGAQRYSSRTLDLDLLLYDDLVLDDEGLALPREEITRHAHVLLPLAEIAPDLTHPLTGERYAALWQAFEREDQCLWPIPFEW